MGFIDYVIASISIAITGLMLIGNLSCGRPPAPPTPPTPPTPPEPASEFTVVGRLVSIKGHLKTTAYTVTEVKRSFESAIKILEDNQ